MKNTILTLGIGIAVSGCTTTAVQLTATNPENYPQHVRLLTKDNPALPGEEMDLGDLQAKETKSFPPFNVKHGKSIEVEGIYQGGVTSRIGPTYIDAKPDPLQMQVQLAGGSHYLDDSSSQKSLTDAFMKIGVPNLSSPRSLPGALSTLYGALIVITPGDDKKDAVIHTVVTPNTLGVKEIDLATFLALIPDVTDEESIDITKNTASSFSGMFPFAGVGVDWAGSDVYQLSWKMNGFGMVQKPEDADKNYIVKYSALDDKIKQQINDSLKAHSGSKLVYVNRLYAIKNAQVITKKGQKIAGNADVKAAVVTMTGSYTFTDTTTTTRVNNNIVLNLEGDEVAMLKVEATTSKLGSEGNAIVENKAASKTSFVTLATPYSNFMKPFMTKATSVLIHTGNKVSVPISAVMSVDNKVVTH
jgi:hypothetical protein